MNIKLSQELFAIPYDDNFIIYAPLKGVIALCNPAMTSILSDLYTGHSVPPIQQDQREAIDSLTKLGLVINDNESDQESVALTPEDKSLNFSPTRATFLVTTNCNLKCVYCYASAGEKQITIPIDVCRATIDFVTNNAVNLGAHDTHFAFHGGGEPTTAFPLIRECVEYARVQAQRCGIECTFSIVTNGLLSDHQIEWLAANMVGISVSLDGPRDIQDRQRPLRNGQSSFDRVFHTIKSLEQLGAHPFVRATITNESVGRMAEISRFFCQSFDAAEFQLEPVSVCGRCATTGYSEPTVDEFVAGVEDAMNVARQYGKKAVCSAALDAFPDLMEAYCGVAAPNFAVTPEGIITACYEVSSPTDVRGELFYYGRFDHNSSQFSFNTNKISRLRQQVIQNIQECRDCFCRWQCAGDCPVRSVWRYSSDMPGEISDFRCDVTRELVKRRLVHALEDDRSVS